jgi:adenine-specific DNA-methyltransferase
MLGKVFENLIEENRRKGLGSFYTPREIVHFKCQQCLISYLDTALDKEKEIVPRKDIETFIHLGEQISHYEAVDAKYAIKMPATIEKHARLIDEKLADITVCDPAVGSGAYPVGMMTEIVRARSALTPYFNDVHDRTPYHFKRHAIQNCLYGVDIDSGAVEIAKLRLWLSLVVDEEDVKQIKPLPNLFYKIVTGNSLLGVEKDVFNERLFQRLEELKPRFFDEPDKDKKDRYKQEIEDTIHELTHGKEAFDFEIYFSEVFHRKGGFDVVIANPPYIGEKGHKSLFAEIKKGMLGEFYLGKVDIFYFFFHLALNITRAGASIAFITTNYFPTADGARKLRLDLRKRATVNHLINLSEVKLFESALGQHNMITLLSKSRDESAIADNCITTRSGFVSSSVLHDILHWRDKQTHYYSVPQDDLYDGADNYIRIQGATGSGGGLTHSVLNKLAAAESRLGDVCVVNIGMRTGADKVSQSHIDDYAVKLEKGQGIYVLTDEEVSRLRLNHTEKAMLLPFFKNSDIRKYHCERKNDLWLIDLTYPKYKDVGWDSIPHIRDHIWRFDKILKNRRSNDNGLLAVIGAGYWWCFTMRHLDFTGEKIVSPQRSLSNTFAFSSTHWVASMDVYFVTQKLKSVGLKFVLSLLNSRLYYFWLYHKGKRKGEALELYQRPLSELPIKRIGAGEQKPFIALVDRILAAKQRDAEADTSGFEREIDELVYSLYGLTAEEIALVQAAAK